MNDESGSLQIVGSPFKVLAFLQNQWAHDPETMRALYERHAKTLDDRARFNARFLFRGSLTGRRLKTAFGERCDRIIWEEASTKIGSESKAAFPPEPDHIRRVLLHHDPDMILVFGVPHRKAIIDLRDELMPHRTIVYFPHPASRQPPLDTATLKGWNDELDRALGPNRTANF